MQLTLYTDYSLRVLIYLSMRHGEIVTINEVTDFYKISRNHLVKVVHNLANKNFIVTLRGKHGGMQLARDPDSITIAEVVRQTEPNFHLVECFDYANNKCVITPVCALKGVLDQARKNFIDLLDQYTLAQAIIDPRLIPDILASQK